MQYNQSSLSGPFHPSIDVVRLINSLLNSPFFSSSSDLKLHLEDVINLRPLLGAWLNTADWNRMWNPLDGEIRNKEQHLSKYVCKHLPSAAFVIPNKCSGTTQAGQGRGGKALDDNNWWLLCQGQNSFYILCLPVLCIFFLWEDGSLGYLWVFSVWAEYVSH